jgi:ABC-type multidrug transport system ATPase subunit
MVITTHSMDEADVLCSRIAIMGGGRLQAIGTQMRLKAVYGDGYRLSITLAVPPGAASSPEGRAYVDSVAQGVDAFVLARVHPAARMHNRVGTSIIYLLPREGIDVAAVFTTMEAAKVATATAARTGVPPPGPHVALITEFGVSQTTLEDVFVRVVEATGGKAKAAQLNA